jgi:hypothetical protein
VSSREVKLNEVVIDTFSVIQKTDNKTKVSGELQSDFSVSIFRNGNLEANSFSIVEVGTTGTYKFQFTPDNLGAWYVEVLDRQDRIHGAEYVCVPELIQDLYTLLLDVWKIEVGRWKIDVNTKQMMFYDIDGTTPLFTFNLYDAAGTPDGRSVFERRRV